MSNTSEKNKKEWSSPSVTRHGDASEIIQLKHMGTVDGMFLAIPGNNPITIGNSPYTG